jgi:hypothetical protein
MEKAMAASTARSAAGGLNPYASGESADLINTYSMNIGVGDFGMARTNAMLALDAGKRNASQFRTAGKYAVQYGMMAAAADTFAGIGNIMASGGAPTSGGVGGGSTTSPSGIVGPQ